MFPGSSPQLSPKDIKKAWPLSHHEMLGIFSRLQQPWEAESPLGLWSKICHLAFLLSSDTLFIQILPSSHSYNLQAPLHWSSLSPLLHSPKPFHSAICYSWSMINKLLHSLSVFHMFALTWLPPLASLKQQLCTCSHPTYLWVRSYETLRLLMPWPLAWTGVLPSTWDSHFHWCILYLLPPKTVPP